MDPVFAATARAKRSARRAAERSAADGTLTPTVVAALLAAAKRCALCGKRFTKRDPATLDHVVPLKLGGLHTIANIQPAHFACNSGKQASPPLQPTLFTAS